MKTLLTACSAVTLLAAAPTLAEDISTHVLDISTGMGGAGIPVTLEKRSGDGWEQIGTGTTQDNGRVEGFDITTEAATYRLVFDMTAYDDFGPDAFFPEIDVTFAVSDTDRHHHVPVLVSAYGYSTYLGN
ncbi:hydroxyisourate hydrolase [Jannaschia rubra]|uniref:hydroxyisourate hydrolase n=1 Tax=Jannaschia rubra TaxID=282197 RepID=UPI002492CEEB|nr:hydroxyisourate hydrolase [Jannaschia rubra]